ncbi:DUF6153 family protein [Streptomyces sp. NPDC086077]|uniref:DUF6153 family protein n=1 Tax=Streptomyces sp. NPDC086077 TaxID=3154862 RepID=UPI0034444591
MSGPTDASSRTAPSGHADASPPWHTPCAHAPEPDCAHATEDGVPGHVEHADADCSAGGIGTSYAPALPAPAPESALAGLLASPGAATAATEGGRAPPDL